MWSNLSQVVPFLLLSMKKQKTKTKTEKQERWGRALHNSLCSNWPTLLLWIYSASFQMLPTLLLFLFFKITPEIYQHSNLKDKLSIFQDSWSSDQELHVLLRRTSTDF